VIGTLTLRFNTHIMPAAGARSLPSLACELHIINVWCEAPMMSPKWQNRDKTTHGKHNLRMA